MSVHETCVCGAMFKFTSTSWMASAEEKRAVSDFRRDHEVCRRPRCPVCHNPVTAHAEGCEMTKPMGDDTCG